ncbi:MAG TPA: hypothetical protein VIJ70_05625, partial [Gaiellaceae bacterium]
FLLIKVGFKTSSYDFGWGAHHTKLFIGVPALTVNLVVAVVYTVLARVRKEERDEAVALSAPAGSVEPLA